MRYVDTNILVRLITNDVPEFAKQAAEAVEAANAGELMIIDAVIEELCFVLEYHANYKLDRKYFGPIFRRIMEAPQIEVSEVAAQAFELYMAQPKLDFVDCLLLAHAEGKAAKLLTFDQTLQKAAH